MEGYENIANIANIARDKVTTSMTEHEKQLPLFKEQEPAPSPAPDPSSLEWCKGALRRHRRDDEAGSGRYNPNEHTEGKVTT